ncbi:hypothetical protein [Stenotrophomonas rhizophila]|uniref:hypothetical protein n=1 Tax=Stenotrophomonas rhizophila TaxID=216778 RepID=UPI001E3D471E|nr:hypothetical protein [Stenotrophomonas rhizophila]
MKTITVAAVVAMLCSDIFGIAYAAEPNVFVEFLWKPRTPGALARQQTLGFVMDGGIRHQVCLAAMNTAAENKSLRIDVRDADDKMVSSNTYDYFKGPKRCYDAHLGRNGMPGKWKFEIFLNGEPSATKTIQVAKTLAEAPFYQPSGIPYVLGRPNYDASIPPKEWSGRLVWVMTVNENGEVTNVEVEAAEGIGERIKGRAIAAGNMSLFPPDPSRVGDPLKYRRELKFAPD